MRYALQQSQQLGMPKNLETYLGKLLEQYKYHITMAHGTLKNMYQSTETHPLHGPEQGSQAAPAMWMYVSINHHGYCRSKRPRSQIYISWYEIQGKHPIDGFVDDTMLCLNEMTKGLILQNRQGYQYRQADEMLQKIMHKIQGNSQFWKQLLWAIGGKLEITKCFFYIMRWSL